MVPRRPPLRPFQKVYSSVPKDIKEAIEEEADSRGLQVSDVIRELLIERFGNRDSGKSNRMPSS